LVTPAVIETAWPGEYCAWCAWVSPAVAHSSSPMPQSLASMCPRQGPGHWHSNGSARRRRWDRRLGYMRDSFAVAEVPTSQEDARNSLPSVAQLQVYCLTHGFASPPHAESCPP